MAVVTTFGLAIGPSAADAARVERMEVVEPLAHGAAEGVTTEQVRAAVLRAAESEHWHAQVMVDGRVKAEYLTQQGRHRATVTIPVDDKEFLIRYFDSYQLGYRRYFCPNRALGNQRMRQARPCRDSGIHPYYNDWVRELADAIQDEVAALAPAGDDPDIADGVPDPMTPRERFAIAEKMRELIAQQEAGTISDEEFEARKRELLLR